MNHALGTRLNVDLPFLIGAERDEREAFVVEDDEVVLRCQETFDLVLPEVIVFEAELSQARLNVDQHNRVQVGVNVLLTNDDFLMANHITFRVAPVYVNQMQGRIVYLQLVHPSNYEVGL